MLVILEKLLPIFLAFFAAVIAKQCGVLRRSDGESLLKASFYITIPALVFVSASQLKLEVHLGVFLVLPVILALVMFAVGRFFVKKMHLPQAERGIALTAPMAVGSAFSLAFVLAAYGSAGVTRVVLFNAVNNPLLFIWVYSLAAAHNPQGGRAQDIVRKVVASPPLWALILGVACNILHVHFSGVVTDSLLSIGNLTSGVVIVGLGLLFSPQRAHFGLATYITALRLGLGLLVGVILVKVLHLHGINAAALLLLAAAPVGFNIVTFASLEKLDDGLAASAVSYSLLVALVLAPIILLLVR